MNDFIFKPFGEMTDDDYHQIGFKSGLEIHQQLLTSKKLFCRCPAGIYSHKYDAEILRHMRPTLSELGEYDGTALMEFKTKKDIIYHINHETVCTYEMDDTPPFEINEEALDISLEIGMLYNCSMIDEIHIARKQYLDGSIPTGFQRTTIVAVNGWVPYKKRRIKIVQLSLEEDSCREVSDIGHTRVYLTDRLGMPLIETVTAPEMHTPNEVMEVGQIISMIARSTGKVRMGAGAARQDVNVSVEGGTRIEIKGVPSLKRIPLLTYNEAMRQWNLLRLRDELHSRGITNKTFESRVENVTKILKKTHYQPIYSALDRGKVAYGVLLRGYKGLLRWKTQTDTYFSREISDRVRVIACLTSLPNIIHSDSTAETLSTTEWSNVKKALSATNDDTVVIVWGDERDVLTATNEIIIRAKEATIGIPSETRQAHKDGTNGFERILPGPDRMYPDTDLPPKRITKERLERIRMSLPEILYEKLKWYEELKIPADTRYSLSISKYSNLFKKLVEVYKINPTLAAVALVQYPKRMYKEKKISSEISVEDMERLFALFAEGKISRDGIYLNMVALSKGEGIVVNKANPGLDSELLGSVMQQSLDEIKKMKIKNKSKLREIILGKMMYRLKGKIEAREVINFLNKNLIL
ncbi:MAG: Glu-tRNA(Gln) amidotransferase subunit GatE [Ignavibacteria bacterium]